MTTSEFLSRLDGVQPRGHGRWSARCPGHPDKSPSLSIREAEDGRILLYDFAGCSPREILSAIGLGFRDLFADSQVPSCVRPERPRLDRRRLALRFELQGGALQERAETVFQAACGLDCARWDDLDFDKALTAVTRAHDDRRHAEVLFDVADMQRVRAFAEGR